MKLRIIQKNLEKSVILIIILQDTLGSLLVPLDPQPTTRPKINHSISSKNNNFGFEPNKPFYRTSTSTSTTSPSPLTTIKTTLKPITTSKTTTTKKPKTTKTTTTTKNPRTITTTTTVTSMTTLAKTTNKMISTTIPTTTTLQSLLALDNKMNNTIEAPTVVDKTESPFSCKKMLMKMGKKQFKAFGECNREIAKEIPCKQERHEKISCILKCSMDKLSMLDEKGLLSYDSFQNFLDKNIPKPLHEFTHIYLDQCIDEFIEKFEPTDEYCKAYGRFIQCTQEQMSEIIDSCS